MILSEIAEKGLNLTRSRLKCLIKIELIELQAWGKQRKKSYVDEQSQVPDFVKELEELRSLQFDKK